MKKYLLTTLLLIIFLVGKSQLIFDYNEINEEKSILNSLRFDFTLLQSQAIGNALIIQGFEIENSHYTLNLEKFQVWDDHTIIETQDENGLNLQEMPILALYKGVVLEHKDSSFVYLAVNESGYAMGYVAFGKIKIPINRPSDKVRIDRLVKDVSKRERKDFCGAEGLESYHSDDESIEVDYENYDRATMLQNVVAIEMDYPCYQIFNSLDEAKEYPFILFGAISGIYERDIQSHFNVSYLHIWTTNDPYTFEYGELCDCDECALEQFRAYWNANFGGVSRNNAVMLCGELGGGCAWVGQLNSSYSYAVCDIDGILVLPIPFNSPDNWDAIVTAHEIGHNYNSKHTHCYNPEIDKCYNQEGGCYNGPVIATHGTIMSYCHLNLGYSAIDMEFHSRCINEKMRPYAASKLNTLPTNLTLISPNTLGHYAATSKITMDPGFSTSHYFEGEILNSGKESGAKMNLFMTITSNDDFIKKFEIESFPIKKAIYPNLWNGTDASGNEVKSGEYQYIITKNGVQLESGSIIIE